MPAAKIQAINVYPIKSSAGITLSSGWVDEFGLLFDRRFVLTTGDGLFITGRTDPKICLIQANITASGFILTAPGMPPLKINYQSFSKNYRNVTVWKDTISGLYCHKEYDLWFSEYLAKSCQLYYFGEHSLRPVKRRTEQVAFADGYPLMMISQASLDDVNLKTQDHFTMAHFRPNLVIENCAAFAEDSWSRIRIGEVEFDIVKACTRCIFTTVDPITAQKHPSMEPLATLKSYRQLEQGKVAFGQNLVPLNQGQISVNDKITVLSTKAAPIFIASSTKKKMSDSGSSTVKQAPADKKSLSTTKSPSTDNDETLLLTCQKIIDETHDVKSFIFTSSSNTKVEYLPGQHLPIALDIFGEKVHATYTLSSSPTRSGSLVITVKRVPGGLVSNHLHDHFNIGDTLTAKKPAGQFHLNTADSSRMLLLSAGSGITPMLSMLKAMVDTAQSNDLVFFHSAHSEQDLIGKNEITALALQHGNCQVSYTLTRSATPQWTGYQGHINEQMLANIPRLTDRQVFVCGPEGFRDTVKTLLLRLGLPEQYYHFESFGKPKNVTPEQQSKSPAKKVNILFDSWDKYIKGNNRETLLEQGEAAGLILPYSCRGGMCGSCKVKLESGEVKQLANDGLSDTEQKEGYILACSCIPSSDVVISNG